jgi:hypothetical protein
LQVTTGSRLKSLWDNFASDGPAAKAVLIVHTLRHG